MHEKFLIVEVRQGLANRLCALAAGMRLAELYGREFLLVWPPEPDCPCMFDELFEHGVRCWANVDDCLDQLGAVTTTDTFEHFVHDLADCLRGLDLSAVDSRVVVLRTPFFCHDRADPSMRSVFARLDPDVLSGPFSEDRVVRAFDAVLQQLRGPLRRFLLAPVPRAEIAEEVDAFSRTHFRGPVHGVHLRGTDNWRCSRARGRLLGTIRRLATAPDGTPVFVAGDDRTVIGQAVALGHGRVVTHATVHDPGRFRQTSMRDALVDLLLLARTQHLHKPPFSSFALVSAAMGEVLWIEPSPELFASLQKNIAGQPRQKAARCLVIDEDGRECEFHLSSNRGMSSSILPLKLHAAIWPHVEFVKTIRIKGRTLPSLLRAERIDAARYDTLVLDTQGTELLVLRGAAGLLRHFKHIQTEAADVEIYEGCCTLADIVAFLQPFGFVEIERTIFSPRPEIGGCYDVLFRRLD